VKIDPEASGFRDFRKEEPPQDDERKETSVMICPKCRDNAHRSHSRSFGESLIKTFTHYKSYRCSKCGWRGIGAPGKKLIKKNAIRTALFWVAGTIIALMIGGYAVRDLQSTMRSTAQPQAIQIQ
jgi:hypothetical protein